jgi:hypothetical protein
MRWNRIAPRPAPSHGERRSADQALRIETGRTVVGNPAVELEPARLAPFAFLTVVSRLCAIEFANDIVGARSARGESPVELV